MMMVMSVTMGMPPNSTFAIPYYVLILSTVIFYIMKTHENYDDFRGTIANRNGKTIRHIVLFEKRNDRAPQFGLQIH